VVTFALLWQHSRWGHPAPDSVHFGEQLRPGRYRAVLSECLGPATQGQIPKPDPAVDDPLHPRGSAGRPRSSPRSATAGYAADGCVRARLAAKVAVGGGSRSSDHFRAITISKASIARLARVQRVPGDDSGEPGEQGECGLREVPDELDEQTADRGDVDDQADHVHGYEVLQRRSDIRGQDDST
jgi:hypothetical protein